MSPQRRRARTHTLRMAGGVLLMVCGVAGCGNSTPTAPKSQNRLVFQKQPAPTPERQLLPPVVVAIENADGVPDSSATAAVTIALGTNPGGATLSGTLTVDAVAGVATFDDLSIDKSGSGYTLAASAGTLTNAESAPFDVAFASPLTVGALHACMVGAGGQAYCWGANGQGQIGDGTLVNRTTPVQVGGGIAFTSLAAGYGTTCGLTAKGEAYCWGLNNVGQLGDSTTTWRTQPTPVAGGHVFASISSGLDHGCAVEAGTRDTYCWGWDEFGQLGDGGLQQTPVPKRILGSSLFGFDAVSAGWALTCATTPGGAGYCWGLNKYGQLGDSTVLDQYAPMPVSGGHTFQSIRVSLYGNLSNFGDESFPGDACGVTPAGDAYCWGHNVYGQLGFGSASQFSSVPVKVFGGLAFAEVSPSGGHTCGVTTDGDAYCWGENIYGQLGDGTISSTGAPAPIAVVGGHKFRFVGTGFGLSCGITTDDEVYCWGRNNYGQLGDGTTTTSDVPVLVTGLPAAVGG